ADWDGRSEIGALPARGGLSDEGRRAEQRAGTTPEAARVVARIIHIFIVPDSADEPINVSFELQAKLDGLYGCCDSGGADATEDVDGGRRVIDRDVHDSRCASSRVRRSHRESRRGDDDGR